MQVLSNSDLEGDGLRQMRVGVLFTPILFLGLFSEMSHQIPRGQNEPRGVWSGRCCCSETLHRYMEADWRGTDMGQQVCRW